MSNTTLTQIEKQVILKALNAVAHCMRKDENAEYPSQAYTENYEDFMLNMSSDEYEHFISAIIKLPSI